MKKNKLGDTKSKLLIGVIGGNICPPPLVKAAQSIGAEIARRGHILICGGLGGVMTEASRGACENGGLTIGILPGKSKLEANPYISIPIVTAMSHARNAIIVRTADALIAIDGKSGTLSEIGLALSLDKPVYGYKTWEIDGIIPIHSAKEALDEIEKNVLHCQKN